MKIAEVLERLKGSNKDVVRETMGIAKDRFAKGLAKAGYKFSQKEKEWLYIGEGEPPLERDFTDFLEPFKREPKKKKQSTSKERSSTSNERSNVRAKKEIELTNEQIATTMEIVIPTKERSMEQTNVIRKRSSFDMDVELLKDLKIQAIIHDRTVYEIVETAVRQYLKELKKD